MNQFEWGLRLELAARYRLFDRLGWAEMIFNHFTLRVSGDKAHFLINPCGLHYAEVTAANRVKIDARRQVVGSSAHPVNPSGFVIHSVIHDGRVDAHCVIHMRTAAEMAVACRAEGLTHNNFYSAQFFGRVAYHDFEGISTDTTKRHRHAELMEQIKGGRTG